MSGELQQGVVAFQPLERDREAVMLGRIEVGEIGPVRDPRSRYPFYFRLELPHARTNARLNPARSIEDARRQVLAKLRDWLNAAGVAPIGAERPDRRAECDRYMKGGGVGRAFVTILEPGKVPSGKGPFLMLEQLDRFLQEALEHHADPATHIIIHQLTWNDELWTECARERAMVDAAMADVDLEQLLGFDEEEAKS